MDVSKLEKQKDVDNWEEQYIKRGYTKVKIGKNSFKMIRPEGMKDSFLLRHFKQISDKMLEEVE